MEYLSYDEFSEYLKSHDPMYLYYPGYDVAYRSVVTGKTFIVFCKHHGQPEVQVPFNDEGYSDSWFDRIVMTKEEYEEF